MPHRHIKSIAIAGAWGYIGRKFLQAALDLGLETYVHDPGPLPADLDLKGVHRLDDEAAFYSLDGDLYHLALHPEHRARAFELLLQEHPGAPLILAEKPMAAPERPEQCAELSTAVELSRAPMLFDFPELFDAMTQRIVDFLTGFKQLSIKRVELRRSKDREDPSNPRNYKKIVPVQYQESVHCLAFVLYLLSHLRGGLAAQMGTGLRARAQAAPYTPPNPESYSYRVDGRCRYSLDLGELHLEGITDFSRGAPWSKRRLIEGVGDGHPFAIEADYLEGAKYLRIDGIDQGFNPDASTYQQVLERLSAWQAAGNFSQRLETHPDPAFATLTYQLSSLLWRASRDNTALHLPSLAALRNFDAGFAAAVASFPAYNPD